MKKSPTDEYMDSIAGELSKLSTTIAERVQGAETSIDRAFAAMKAPLDDSRH